MDGALPIEDQKAQTESKRKNEYHILVYNLFG